MQRYSVIQSVTATHINATMRGMAYAMRIQNTTAKCAGINQRRVLTSGIGTFMWQK